MPVDATAESLIQTYEQLRASRGTLEADLQDIVDLVRPSTVQFNRQTAEGEPRYQYKYDGTAIEALNEFASGLCSYLTNPTERWFELEFVDYDPAWDDEALLWLENVTDTLYEALRYPISGFNTAIHEAFLDVGSLGTCVVNQEIATRPFTHISFRNEPLAKSYVMENENGVIDSVFRIREFTRRNLVSKFNRPGDFLHPSIFRGEEQMKKWQVMQCVFPRDSFDLGGIAVKKPIASVWVDMTHKVVIRESGFDHMPFHIGRWIRCGEEPYGRSPAHVCLPEIRMVNMMEKTNIRAGQKLVDPPLMVPDDMFALPLKTHPGALMFKNPGSENIEPLLSATQLPVALEQTEQKREAIRRCFHIDWLKLGKEKQEMTAFETDDRRSEKLRMLAPVLGRLQSELLGPLIETTFSLLTQLGKIPSAPSTIDGASLRVTYVGGAAKAQMGMRASSTARFIEDLMPMAQLKPDILDVIDEEKLAQELAISRGASRKVLRDPRQLAEMRQQRQMQALVAQAEPASKALKNVADARATGAL